jgi:hypothetical protein
MTDTPTTRAAAEMAFRTVTPEERLAGMDEYKAELQAKLDNMARLRAMRLAREAERGGRG